MKTAISLPDRLFEEAERLAEKLQISRSDLYQKAIEDYIARHDPDRVREAIDRVVAEVGGSADQSIRAAAVKVLEENEW